MFDSKSPRLKYSKRLAIGATCVAATLSSASAAVTIVEVKRQLGWGGGEWVSFNPIGSDYTLAYNTNYLGAVRNCGVNLVSYSSNLQWTNAPVAEGSVIDESLTWGNAPFLSYMESGTAIIMGYRVLNQGANNDEIHYGYVRLTGVAKGVDPYDPANAFRFDSYTYESSPNTPITVPEASAACFILSGAGMLTLRRRRKA